MTPEQHYARLIPIARSEARHSGGYPWQDLLHDALLGAYRNAPETMPTPPISYVRGWIRGLARRGRTLAYRRPADSLDWQLPDTEGYAGDTRGDTIADPSWETENVGLRWTAADRARLHTYICDTTPESTRASRTRGWREGAKARARSRRAARVA